MGQQSLQVRPAVAGKPQEVLHVLLEQTSAHRGEIMHPKYITSHFPGCSLTLAIVLVLGHYMSPKPSLYMLSSMALAVAKTYTLYESKTFHGGTGVARILYESKVVIHYAEFHGTG